MEQDEFFSKPSKRLTKRKKLRFKDFTDFRADEDSGLPEHQLERGPRHGNNRQMYSKAKVTDRRQERRERNRQPFDFED